MMDGGAKGGGMCWRNGIGDDGKERGGEVRCSI